MLLWTLAEISPTKLTCAKLDRFSFRARIASQVGSKNPSSGRATNFSNSQEDSNEHYIDRNPRRVSAWWWGLGIFPLAQVVIQRLEFKLF